MNEEDDVNEAFRQFLKNIIPGNNVSRIAPKKDSYTDILFIRDTLGISNSQMCTMLDIRDATFYTYKNGGEPDVHITHFIQTYHEVAKQFDELGRQVTDVLLRRPIFKGSSFIEKVRNNKIKLETNDLLALIREVLVFHKNEALDKIVDDVLSAPFNGGLSFKECLKEYLSQYHNGQKLGKEDSQNVIMMVARS